MKDSYGTEQVKSNFFSIPEQGDEQGGWLHRALRYETIRGEMNTEL